MINKQTHGLSIKVKTVTRMMAGPILVFGISLVLHGHLFPGGGFAGGIIIALAFIMIILAFGKETELAIFPQNAAHLIMGLGGLIFTGIALYGITKGAFLINFIGRGKMHGLYSSGTIQLLNIALCMCVCSGLMIVFTNLIQYKPRENEIK